MSTRTRSRSADAHMQARRRRLKAMGKWQSPYVDAEPVREHLRKVNAAGMPYWAICEQLGLPHESSLQCLVWGRGPYGPSQKVSRETAELVLAYWPTLDHFPDSALIDRIGSLRRVQALAVQGWSRNQVARQIGMREDNFRKAISQDRVTVRIARRVAAAYDVLWNKDPMDHGGSLNAVSRVRAGATRAGWYGPLAWDDDTIDNPQAVPQTDAVEPVATEGGNVAARWLMGESVVLRMDDRREVLQHLFEWSNDTTAEIAARLEMTPSAAERQWERIKEKAAEEGRRVWRRAYIPRERELKQNEMGEAA